METDDLFIDKEHLTASRWRRPDAVARTADRFCHYFQIQSRPVGRLVRNEGRQCVEQFEDIVERRRLQLARAVQVLTEDGERLLGSLARGTGLIEAPLAVKFLDGGGSAVSG